MLQRQHGGSVCHLLGSLCRSFLSQLTPKEDEKLKQQNPVFTADISVNMLSALFATMHFPPAANKLFKCYKQLVGLKSVKLVSQD